MRVRPRCSSSGLVPSGAREQRGRCEGRCLAATAVCAAAALLVSALLSAGTLAVTAKQVIPQAPTDRVFFPQLSPSGRYLAYEILKGSRRQLQILDVQTGNHLKLPASETTMFSTKGYQGQICWSPAVESAPNELFAFVKGKEDNPDVFIGRIDAAGQILVTQISADPAVDYYPRFSPDGRWLLYLSGRNRTRGADIYIAGPITDDGTLGPAGGTHRLTDGQRNCLFPQWSPSGTAIAFSSDSADVEESASRLYGIVVGRLGAMVANSDLEWSERFPARALQLNTKLSLKIPSWSPDGRYLACYTRRESASPAPAVTKPKTADGGTAVTESEELHEPNGIAVIELGRDVDDPFSGARLMLSDVGFPVSDLMENSYSHGPVWLSTGARIVTCERDLVQDFPVVIFDVNRRAITQRHEDTKINRDVSAVRTKTGDSVLFTAHHGQTVNVFRLQLEDSR